MALRAAPACNVATTGPRTRASPAPHATGRVPTALRAWDVSMIERGTAAMFDSRGEVRRSITDPNAAPRPQ